MTAAQAGPETAIERAIAEIAFRGSAGSLDGATIPGADAERFVASLGLGSTEELALAALPVARRLADPPISGYRVAAVGIEAESGDLLLGGNREFPGTELGTTIHAEGFVALRARRRGRTLATLALRIAHPCAHCRQVLAESSSADGLLLVDTEGARLGLADLYPWAFQPAALGMDGDLGARISWPALAFEGDRPLGDVADELLDAGRHAHAPYSGAPSAALLRTRDGRQVSAGCVESVAFNPSISALQAALVELAAVGVGTSEITEAWLGRTARGPIDPEPGFRALIGAVAPDASVHVVRWRTGA